ncbi:MAG: M36 family metallopeptidase, partial [Terriglobales bacterium]
MQFLSDNASVFGLSASDLARLRPWQEDRDEVGIAHLTFRQEIGGIPVFQSGIAVHVDGRGQVVSVEGSYTPNLQPPRNRRVLSARDAVLRGMELTVPDLLDKVIAKPPAPGRMNAKPPRPGESAVTIHGAPLPFPETIEPEKGVSSRALFEAGPLRDPIPAELVIFPEPNGQSELAWQMMLHAPDRAANYIVLLDAARGDLLYRFNTYQSTNASVILQNPDATPPTTVPFQGNPTASPLGWNSATGIGGNNVRVFGVPNVTDYIFPFTDGWKLSGANTFDLTNKRLRLTPYTPPGSTTATGYTVSVSNSAGIAPGMFDLKPVLANTDDASVAMSCTDSLALFGQTYGTLYVNTNGSASFGGPVSSYADVGRVGFHSKYPRIGAMLLDLELSADSSTLSASCITEGAGQALYVAWIGARAYGLPSSSHTFAITVHGNNTPTPGVIDIDWGAQTATSGIMVGVGGSPAIPPNSNAPGEVSYVDVTASNGLSFPNGVAEKFPMSDYNFTATTVAYQLNWMHDYFYQRGFTESLRNFQTNNFGRGGIGGDPIDAEAQYTSESGGAIYNNAYFATQPDGWPGFTVFGMMEFSPGCLRDSSLDASVVRHELTHGVTNRVVGGGVFPSLTTLQAGALGEGWSDAFAILTLNDPVAGAYVTCNPTTGIRSVAYNNSPYTYADFGNLLGPWTGGIGNVWVPEVHADGEIWASVAWDMRTAVGSTVAEQLLFDGLRYTPANPTMVDARNGILVADATRYGGAHIPQLLTLFANRGLGSSAESSRVGQPTVVFAAFDTADAPYGFHETALLEETFDSGAVGWTTAGSDGAGAGALWHVEGARFASPPSAAYYGKSTTGTYDTGARNYGALRSPAITLPASIGNGQLVLEWDQYKDSECCGRYDGGFVRVISLTDLGASTQLSYVSSTAGFEKVRVNLNRFAGKQVQIEFYFDTFDEWVNNLEGWWVDNVRVVEQSPCAYSINPASALIGTGGGPGSISITAQPSCAWTVISNSPFITITSASSGVGNGAITYSVAANAGVARTGTITVMDQTFTMSQAGTQPPAAVSVTPNSGSGTTQTFA